MALPKARPEASQPPEGLAGITILRLAAAWAVAGNVPAAARAARVLRNSSRRTRPPSERTAWPMMLRAAVNQLSRCLGKLLILHCAPHETAAHRRRPVHADRAEPRAAAPGHGS